MHRPIARLVLLALVFLAVSCGKSADEDKLPSTKEMVKSASVDWARDQLPELEKKLASADPGAASSTCAVIKPDLPAIAKSDPDLFATLTKRCTHDLKLRTLAVAVDRAEVARKAKPTGMLFECTEGEGEAKDVGKAGFGAEPEVAPLTQRLAAACPR